MEKVAWAPCRLSSQVARIELGLRAYLQKVLGDDLAILPSHLVRDARQRWAKDGIHAASIAHPRSGSMHELLSYFDLRDLEATITSKRCWPHFASRLVNKVKLTFRFAQLAELRNALAHFRPVGIDVHLDGLAAIAWFSAVLAAV